MGMSASRVSCQLFQNIRLRVSTRVMIVSAEYMMHGPSTLRTEEMSLVAWAMRSPVEVCWK